ncbi:FAD-dependent oxidoreductase [Corallincola platygyrae]|uniref:FAD-dependent oxidoreductase n=1 Tax=Corallincola platygyrae TaxID=1193278 RepID=A0ABW4XPR8_9GAMM
MSSYDLIVVGGGMVGLSLAAALADTPLRVAVIDKGQPPVGQASDNDQSSYTNRVSALNHNSEQFLRDIGAWQHIAPARLSPYQQMSVWEKDSFARIGFAADELAMSHLGHIVENSHICAGLYQAVKQAANVDLLYGVAPKKLRLSEREAWLLLDDDEPVSAPLMVAGDGAHSWLRQQARLPLTFWDYDHHALVATIKTDLPHSHTAYQIFTPDGPLAFLPLPEDNLCSIVWSLPPELAKQHGQASEAEFNKQLATAFDMKLGLCELQGERAVIPLTMRYARNWSCDRVVLMGDAAHTIHPLAGQGVNLGFQDAKALAKHLLALADGNKDIGLRQNLRAYERERKAETVAMIAAMEGIKRLFSNDIPPLKLLRGVGMRVADELTPLKQQLAKLAIEGVPSP